MRFCRSCRCLILSDFRYCPYCGEPAPRGPDLGEALERPFSRLEGGGEAEDEDARSLSRAEAPQRVAADPFARAEGDLVRLEAEIEELLASGSGKPDPGVRR